jgi:Serine dehydrogenase proteinase
MTTINEKNNRQERFPRTSEPPRQSPLFWVEQKDRYLRQILIRDIQEETNRKFIVYFANRYELGSDIDHRDCAIISELFRDVGNDPVDLMIETNGGNTDATDSLVSYLRNVSTDIRVVVANAAKSNGTVIALMAKSIVMGPSSELGPIEPAVQTIPCSILIQPQVAQQNFPLHMYGVYALRHTQGLATKLLKEGMMNHRADADIASVVQRMSTRDTYASHGSAIDYNEAEALGLTIEKLGRDDPLWKKIWLLHCMYEYDCRKSRYLKIFEGPLASTAIAIPPKAEP